MADLFPGGPGGGGQWNLEEFGGWSVLSFLQGFLGDGYGGGEASCSVQCRTRFQFSLMQYSEDFQTHFTFKDFRDNPDPRQLVRPIRQLFGKTHTATGIRKVV